MFWGWVLGLSCSLAFAVSTTDMAGTNENPLSPLQSEKIHELSRSRYWYRLMRYRRPPPFFTIDSEVDGAGFFFDPEGKTSPEKEMLATVRAFYKNIKVGKLNLHPQCAFPVRYKFLKKELNLEIADVSCPELEKHMNALNPGSVSLVYSSAYAGNPGSMFGHTFFRINSDKPGQGEGSRRTQLLDWGIGFAAAVPQETGGLEFAIRGVSGGFTTQFSLMPYYSKVNEYINSESRDLWEYDLSLTKEQTLTLLQHIWEVETNSHFDYFFFDENCAYQLMTALEVARPDWNLSDFGPHVIPAETIKRVVAIKGAVVDVKFRPSLKKKAIQRYELLSNEEKERFNEILEGKREPELETSPTVLEGVGTYLQYRKQLTDDKLTTIETQLLSRSLLSRSKLGLVDRTKLYAGPMVGYSEDSRPEIGHHPYLISTSAGLVATGGGDLENGYFQELQFRFAHHDLLNDDIGYERYSHIEFGRVAARYYTEEKKFSLDYLNFVAVTSITPMTFFEKKASFGFGVRLYEPKDLDCRTCYAGQMEAGIGAALPLGAEQNAIYALGWVYGEFGSGLNSLGRFGPKFSLGLLLNPWRAYKTQFVAYSIFDILQSTRQMIRYQLEWNQSFSFSQSWEMRTSLLAIIPTRDGARRYNEVRLSLNYYF